MPNQKYPATTAFIELCRSEVGEPCFWFATYNSQRCRPDKKCSRALIYFPESGSCQEALPMEALSDSDEAESEIQETLWHFADHGYVAICADLFESKEGSLSLPHVIESHRVDRIIESITTHDQISRVWSGENLLLSGQGSSSTAIAVSIGRTEYDQKETWKGSQTTGICLIDGVGDILAWNREMLAPSSMDTCRSTRDSQICQRYFGTPTCNPRHRTPDMENDSLVHVQQNKLRIKLDDLSIKHWKLVNCQKQCRGPQTQFSSQLFCRELNQKAAKHCTAGDEANALCDSSQLLKSHCQKWFENLKPNH